MFTVKTIGYGEDFAYDNIKQIIDDMLGGEFAFNDIVVVCDSLGRKYSARTVVGAHIQELIEEFFSSSVYNEHFISALLELVDFLGSANINRPEYESTYCFVDNSLKRLTPTTTESYFVLSRVIFLLSYLKQKGD